MSHFQAMYGYPASTTKMVLPENTIVSTVKELSQKNRDKIYKDNLRLIFVRQN